MLQVVGVGPGQIGVDAHEHDGGALGDEAARDQLRADRACPRRHVFADLGAAPGPRPSTAPAGARCRRDRSSAKIGARGRSADSRRAVPPPRVTATIACASPRVASVTAASQSACAWSCADRRSEDDGHASADGLDFGVADDRVERLHGARRIRADRRFARQHDRVDAIVDGVGGVADFGPRRPRLRSSSTRAPASRRSPECPAGARRA